VALGRRGAGANDVKSTELPIESTTQEPVPETISSTGGSRVLLQFDAPVGLAQEAGPAIDADTAAGVEGLERRPHGAACQWHASLLRSAIGLAGVALDAGQHAILPACRSSL